MVTKVAKMLFALGMFSATVSANQAFAQFANTTLQLPTFRVTQFNTAISVPDGGTARLGGVTRSQSFPGGRSTTAGSAQVTAHVLIMSELEQEMLANARPAILQSNFNHRRLNGSAQTQAQADFISGNINRRCCLLYTSPSPRDQRGSRMPSSA